MRWSWKRWPTLLLVLSFAGLSLACPPEEDPDPEDMEVSVQDQTLEFDEADRITVERAIIDRPGFVVIYDDDDDQHGSILGASQRIDTGTTENFTVDLDRRAEDGETMWAVLHYDAYDDADDFQTEAKQPPVTDPDGELVVDSFEVTVEDEPIDPDEPFLNIEDQTLPEDEADVITVDEAVLVDDGFVVIWEEEDDEPSDIIGSSDLLEEGMHTDFEIELDRDAEDEETLWGQLHEDELGTGEFEDADDQPAVIFDDEPVRDSFDITIEEEPDPPPEDEPSITAEDQTLDELSTIVTVDEVEVLDDGWVVIHRGACDDFGAIIGNEWVQEGTHTDVDVELEEPAADLGESDDLCAMLHVDDGDEVFDDDDDLPAEDADGDIVMDTFTATVEDGTPAIRVTLDAEDGPPAWTLDDVEPGLFEDEIADNDEIVFNFRADWRYEIDNQATDDHPFEFLNEEDEPLLSQEVDGDDAPLEVVATIDWFEEDDIFRFTVSDDFSEDTGVVDDELLDGTDQVTGYHSATQPNMTGPVEYR